MGDGRTPVMPEYEPLRMRGGDRDVDFGAPKPWGRMKVDHHASSLTRLGNHF